MDPEAEFWKEDADRLNEMCVAARETKGGAVRVLPRDPTPPQLNPDGGYASTVPPTKPDLSLAPMG